MEKEGLRQLVESASQGGLRQGVKGTLARVAMAHNFRRRELPLRRRGSQAVQSRDSRQRKESV